MHIFRRKNTLVNNYCFFKNNLLLCTHKFIIVFCNFIGMCAQFEYVCLFSKIFIKASFIE